MNEFIIEAYLDELNKLAESEKVAIGLGTIGAFLKKGITGLAQTGRMAAQKGGLKWMGQGLKGTYSAAGGGMKGVGAIAKHLAPQAAVLGGTGLAGYGALKGTGALLGRNRGPHG